MKANRRIRAPGSDRCDPWEDVVNVQRASERPGGNKHHNHNKSSRQTRLLARPADWHVRCQTVGQGQNLQALLCQDYGPNAEGGESKLFAAGGTGDIPTLHVFSVADGSEGLGRWRRSTRPNKLGVSQWPGLDGICLRVLEHYEKKQKRRLGLYSLKSL